MYEDEYDVRRGIKRYITIVFYVFFGLIFLGIYCVKRLKKGIKKLKERNWDCLIDFIAFSSYFIYFLYGAIILSFIYTCIPEKVNGYEILLNIPIYLNNLLLIAGLFWKFYIKDRVAEHIWIKPLKCIANEDGNICYEVLCAHNWERKNIVVRKKLDKKLRKRNIDDPWVFIKLYKNEMYGSFRTTSQKSLQNVKVDVNKEPVSPRKMFNKINSIMRKIAALISVLFLGETYIMWSTVGVVINKIRFIMPEELGNAIMSMSDPNEVMNVISPYVKYVTLPDLLSFKNFVTGFGVDAPLEGVIYAISIFVIIALIASIWWQMTPPMVVMAYNEFFIIGDFLNGTAFNLEKMFDGVTTSLFAVLLIVAIQTVAKYLYKYVWADKTLKYYLLTSPVKSEA